LVFNAWEQNYYKIVVDNVVAIGVVWNNLGIVESEID
jgi:hypothetical protein